MARARVDESMLGPEALARREAVLAQSRARAAAWRARTADARLGSFVSTVEPVKLTAEEDAVAHEIIQAALARVAAVSAEDELAALIKSQAAEIATAQAEYDMPTWYNGAAVTLFVYKRYEKTRHKDNDPRRPRYQTLIDYQLPAVQGLAGSQVQAVREFQDGVRWNTQNAVGVYQPINRVLRGFAEPDYSQWQSKDAVMRINRNLKWMDQTFNYFTVPESLLTFRGIRGAAAFPRKGAAHAGNFAREFAQWRPGQVRSDSGYLSTTLSRTVADKQFTVGHDDGSTEPYVIELRVPAGTRAISMNAINPGSNYQQTVELLIDRDTQFRVIAKYDDYQGGHIIHRAVVDILPPGQQAGRKKLPVYRVENPL